MLLPDRAPPHARPELSDPRGRERNLQLLGTAVSCFHCYFSTVFAERCEAIAHAHGLRL